MSSPHTAPTDPPELARAADRLAGLAEALAESFEALAPSGPGEPYDRGRAAELRALAGSFGSAAADVAETTARVAGAADADDAARLGARAFDQAYDLGSATLSLLRLAAVAAGRADSVGGEALRRTGAAIHAALGAVLAEARQRSASLEPDRELELRRRILDVWESEAAALVADL